MNTAFVVCETAGQWIADVVAAVRATGLRAELVTEPLEPAELTRLADVVDGFIVVGDVRDAESVAEAIRARTPLPAGLVTAAEGIVASVARAAELLGVARCPASVFTMAHNKFAVRQALAAAGLPGPRCALISAESEAASVAEAVGLPAIVKPVNGAASNLVRTVSTVEELAAAYRLLAERLPLSEDARYHRLVGSVDPLKVFLVEGLLRGPEYAVDVLVRDGVAEPVAVVEKPLIDERKFELGMVCPPLELSEKDTERLFAAATAAALALGLDNTCAHLELIDDAELGPTIVEVNAGRPAGGAQPVLLKLATGIDVIAEAVSLALGTPPPARGKGLPVPVGYLIFYAEGAGRLVRVEGTDEVADLPEVLEVVTIVRPGQLLTDDQEIYAVNVLAAGFADTEDLAALHAEAAKLIRFELEES
ncbi:ATP-grasp domain-containing protein [Amycolatopsis keratiniphila]|uniref:ATP-grasp domain-containing protein n=1 Tax=Amycolatopsis keratiniphila TaxID=129921 RepID=UPI00087B78F3|nr:ATP-grasp domain-containing protein [Amycolatopsis keratiniphila]OLZ48108.1 biotin carboxylase [Amycolatopsis keratiniphila subsp. nogabecina]SDU26490.1 ATP-grasp domain-containing protein [Amycolatopsis keratiniphila]